MMTRKLLHIISLSIVFGCFLLFSGVSTTFGENETAPGQKQTVKTVKSAQKAKAVKRVPSKQVEAVQEALNKAGFKLKVDGLIGKETRVALKEFQKKNGLKVTGKIGKTTLAKLDIK